MRASFLFILLFWIVSCSSDHKPQPEVISTKADTVLRLPQLVAGMRADSSNAAIRISAVTGNTLQIYVAFTGDTSEAVLNIYADSALGSSAVDSIINRYCDGKDLRLIGTNSGQQLAVPFHALHRFPARTDTIGMSDNICHLVFVNETEVSVNDWKNPYARSEDYFRAFYGNAFHPLDSSLRFPQRKPHRQTVESLMMEGQSWDETDMKNSPDTAAMLAAYNNFVNKLEVYQKAGSYCTMNLAVMEIDPGFVSWSRLLAVLSEHYFVVNELRTSAVKYLSDRIANNGGDPALQLTDEDLRLLYPDRLRWNGRMSGTHEHYYDPHLLAPWRWVENPPPVKAPPPQDSPDV
jgi:hypothetical protein